LTDTNAKGEMKKGTEGLRSQIKGPLEEAKGWIILRGYDRQQITRPGSGPKNLGGEAEKRQGVKAQIPTKVEDAGQKTYASVERDNQGMGRSKCFGKSGSNRRRGRKGGTKRCKGGRGQLEKR